jgi:hypothetical protein
MTNVEKYVRSHETGELVRVEQAQAEAMQVTERKAATLDNLLTLSQSPLSITDMVISKKYLPILDAILVAANARRKEDLVERDKHVPLTPRQGQLYYLITDDCASEMGILETLYSDRSRDEYLRDLQTVRDYWDRITDKL